MTCHHKAGDPNCTSYSYPTPTPKTPDKYNYEIVDFWRLGAHVIIKAKYPNCNSCSYEGNKIMVFKCSEVDIVKWREIDPHFRDPKIAIKPNQAPSPIARFPASEEGWENAILFVKLLEGKS